MPEMGAQPQLTPEFTAQFGKEAMLADAGYPSMEAFWKDKYSWTISKAGNLFTKAHAWNIEDDAKELAQIVALSLETKSATYKRAGGNNFYGWFNQLINNAFADYMRKRLRTDDKVVQLESMDRMELFTLISDGSETTITEKIHKDRQKQWVNWAIEQLPPGNQRNVATLTFLEDKSYWEIQEILGIPLGTVKSSLSLAKKALREKLQNKAQ